MEGAFLEYGESSCDVALRSRDNQPPSLAALVAGIPSKPVLATWWRVKGMPTRSDSSTAVEPWQSRLTRVFPHGSTKSGVGKVGAARPV